MIRTMFETTVNAPLPVIWKHYVDQELRKKWETDLESIEYEGDIATGTHGVMKLSGMPPIRFLLSRIEENREFTDEVILPDLGKLEFRHEMFDVDGVSHIRQTVTFLPASGHAGKEEHQFFQQVTGDIPEAVFRLKQVVAAPE